ncbi:hypothetical protein BC2230_30019 [Burkholderia cepacia]
MIVYFGSEVAGRTSQGSDRLNPPPETFSDQPAQPKVERLLRSTRCQNPNSCNAVEKQCRGY